MEVARIVMGNVQPIIREGLLSQCPETFHVEATETSGSQLVDRAIRLEASILVSCRDEIVDLRDSLPRGMLAVGVSSSSYDVVLLIDGRERHVKNPSPEDLFGLMQQAFAQ